MRSAPFFLVLGVVACHVEMADAQVAGSGRLAGRLSFTARRCGADRGPAEVIFTLAPGGTWTAGSGEGLALGGSSRAIGKGGRKLALEFDPASAADFATDRGRDIASLCEVADVVVQSVTATSFVLALNRKRTRATLLVVYRLMAAAGGVDRRATFRLRAAGRWTPG